MSIEKVCMIPGCAVKSRSRGMCSRCYSREYARALRGASDYFTAADLGTSQTIAEMAEDDIAEFEFLIASGEGIGHALTRVGMCGRSMARRYQALGRPVPDGLWTAAGERKKVAA